MSIGEEKLLTGCLRCNKYMGAQYELKDPETIKDPFVKRVFLKMKEAYDVCGELDWVGLYLVLPEETRRKDIQIVMDWTLQEDEKKLKLGKKQ